MKKGPIMDLVTKVKGIGRDIISMRERKGERAEVEAEVRRVTRRRGKGPEVPTVEVEDIMIEELTEEDQEREAIPHLGGTPQVHKCRE